MCCFDGGVLQNDLLHAERMQALVHVRNGILRLVGGCPTSIEHACDSSRVCADSSPQECGEHKSEYVLRDGHTRNIYLFQAKGTILVSAMLFR
ncbi:hypothetical protein SAMN05720465_2719 [Fibrobacter sp. UWB10]|nr:hypothetical protein SAMN05720465_2719 [Fibrobacter sp. UWB10]